jgi:hypothetical protein
MSFLYVMVFALRSAKEKIIRETNWRETKMDRPASRAGKIAMLMAMGCADDEVTAGEALDVN